jgi:hypothetical protein
VWDARLLWRKCIGSFHKCKPTVEEQQYQMRLPELMRHRMNERLTIPNLPRNLKMIIRKLYESEQFQLVRKEDLATAPAMCVMQEPVLVVLTM